MAAPPGMRPATGPRIGAQAFEADPTALADSSPYPAIDAAMLNMMTNNVSNPLRVVPPGFVEESIKLLLKVVGNILSNPAERKFRSLKKANKQVAAKILPCRGALQLLTACGFRSADGILTMADEMVDVPKLEYAKGRLGGVGAEKAAAEESAAKAAEEARLALYRQQQEDRKEDRETKLVERAKLDEQRAEFARRAELESAEYVPPAVAAGEAEAAVAATPAAKAAAARDAATGGLPAAGASWRALASVEKAVEPMAAAVEQISAAAAADTEGLGLEEQMTKLLLKLDGVAVGQDTELRAARKAQVNRVQGLLDALEAKRG